MKPQVNEMATKSTKTTERIGIETYADDLFFVLSVFSVAIILLLQHVAP